MTSTKLWQEASFPRSDQFDGLFILGGPMNVYELNEHPWLAAEQQFIARTILQDKPILGVCLGAQLLAVVLGGPVTENQEKEIGWFPIELTPAGHESALFQDFPDSFMAFHWHGDCFSIPPGAVHVAKSEACDQQAFVYENRVVGLQFHLESTQRAIAALTRHCEGDMSCGPFIQDSRAMDAGEEHLSSAHHLLDKLLERLQGAVAERQFSVTS